MSNALLIFVRFPRPGKVKTRLAQALGNEQATEFYYLCADNIIKEAGKLAGDRDYHLL